MEVICNKRYKCRHIHKCQHAFPHKPLINSACTEKIGGAWAICDLAGIQSICVEIKNGYYNEEYVEWCICPICNNEHRHSGIRRHKISTTARGLKNTRNK